MRTRKQESFGLFYSLKLHRTSSLMYSLLQMLHFKHLIGCCTSRDKREIGRVPMNNITFLGFEYQYGGLCRHYAAIILSTQIIRIEYLAKLSRTKCPHLYFLFFSVPFLIS